MMIRYLPTLLAALAVAVAVWWVMDLRADRAALMAENARLSASMGALREQAEQAALARQVEAARAERWRARSAELTETIDQIRGTPDAPLDPRIIDILDGLRPGD